MPPCAACSQPKFLTKAERAALALQRRQEETAGLRAQQEEMRRLQQAQQQVGRLQTVRLYSCSASQSLSSSSMQNGQLHMFKGFGNCGRRLCPLYLHLSGLLLAGCVLRSCIAVVQEVEGLAMS